MSNWFERTANFLASIVTILSFFGFAAIIAAIIFVKQWAISNFWWIAFFLFIAIIFIFKKPILWLLNKFLNFGIAQVKKIKAFIYLDKRIDKIVERVSDDTSNILDMINEHEARIRMIEGVAEKNKPSSVNPKFPLNRDLTGRCFISRGFLWQYIDKEKTKVFYNPLCLYCFERDKLFFHMKDLGTDFGATPSEKTFECPHCKEKVTILFEVFKKITKT